MKAEDFDEKFDQGKSVIAHLDMAKARRPELEQKRVNVDFPFWMIHSLDKEAKAGLMPATQFEGIRMFRHGSRSFSRHVVCRSEVCAANHRCGDSFGTNAAMSQARTS